jgi:hypothetical protein
MAINCGRAVCSSNARPSVKAGPPRWITMGARPPPRLNATPMGFTFFCHSSTEKADNSCVAEPDKFKDPRQRRGRDGKARREPPGVQTRAAIG